MPTWDDAVVMNDNGKQVTWGGRFKDGPAGLMLAFGESVSFDQRLAPYDCRVASIMHPCSSQLEFNR